MRQTAVTKYRKPEPDERQIDLEDWLDIPAFLLAENRPTDLQERADARRRNWRERQASKKVAEAEPVRKGVPRRMPRDYSG